MVNDFWKPGFPNTYFPLQKNKDRGIAIYSKTPLKNLERAGSTTSASDCTEIIHFVTSKVKVIAIYKSPLGKLARLLQELDEVLKTSRHKNVIITGDFNVEKPYFTEEEEKANPLKKATMEMKTLGQWMKRHQLQYVPLGNGGTTDHGSEIDHIWATKQPKAAFKLDAYYSDHKMLLFTLWGIYKR